MMQAEEVSTYFVTDVLISHLKFSILSTGTENIGELFYLLLKVVFYSEYHSDVFV